MFPSLVVHGHCRIPNLTSSRVILSRPVSCHRSTYASRLRFVARIPFHPATPRVCIPIISLSSLSPLMSHSRFRFEASRGGPRRANAGSAEEGTSMVSVSAIALYSVSDKKQGRGNRSG